MNVTQAYAAIAALDLSTIRNRLMHPHAGLGWSAARTHAAEGDYREFLALAKLRPGDTPAPTTDVDCFWHYHILDTMKYAADCAHAFGYFLHHTPEAEFDEEDAQDARLASYCSLAGLVAAQAAMPRPTYCSRAAA